jgi:predicted lipoprotein
VNVHEPTAHHLREQVSGPVVVWEVGVGDGAARALSIAHIVNTWHRPDMFTVILGEPEQAAANAAAATVVEFAADLNLTRSWVLHPLAPGQREALAERAIIWLSRTPTGSLTAAAEALAALLDQRAA